MPPFSFFIHPFPPTSLDFLVSCLNLVPDPHLRVSPPQNAVEFRLTALSLLPLLRHACLLPIHSSAFQLPVPPLRVCFCYPYCCGFLTLLFRFSFSLAISQPPVSVGNTDASTPVTPASTCSMMVRIPDYFIMSASADSPT